MKRAGPPLEPHFKLAFVFARGQTSVTMKTRPQLLLLAGAVVLALGACATLVGGRGGVSLHEAYIEIHPGTNISIDDDENHLRQILGEYKSYYYKIKKTENGRVRTWGELKDIFIERKLVTEATNAGGVSYWTLQIGTKAHPDHHLYPDRVRGHEIGHPDTFTRRDYEKMAEMVRRVTPILKKYSRD
jgi:hypothetical protein